MSIFIGFHVHYNASCALMINGKIVFAAQEERFSRVKNENIEEIILATNSTLEGETTSHFIFDNLKDIQQLKVTKLARGVPLGGELEYVDRGTIMHAFSGRQDLKGKE